MVKSLDTILDHLKKNGGSLGIHWDVPALLDKSENQCATVAYEFGQEAPDSPMAGGASYGLEASIEEALDKVAKEISFPPPPEKSENELHDQYIETMARRLLFARANGDAIDESLFFESGFIDRSAIEDRVAFLLSEINPSEDEFFDARGKLLEQFFD